MQRGVRAGNWRQETGRQKIKIKRGNVECNKTFITLQLMEFEMLARKIFVVVLV